MSFIPSASGAGQGQAKDGAPTSRGTMQLITFSLGREEYGVDIMAVREIKVWSESTALPNTPRYVRGVINLRGVIVPIFDLRARFGQGLTETTKKHVVIIVAVEERTIGILVDAVSDIVTVDVADIRPVPETEYGQEHTFLNGLVTVDDQMVALIAPAKLFSRESASLAGRDGQDEAPALAEESVEE